MGLWKWIKHYHKFLFKFKPYSDQIKKKDENGYWINKNTGKEPMRENVYDCGPTLGEYVKCMNVVHKFKYLVAVPAICFFKWILGKHLVTKVPDKFQFINLAIFDKAFDKAAYDWSYSVIPSSRREDPKPTRKFAVNYFKNAQPKMLRDMKDLLKTIVKNDTAYLEFFNLLMFNISIEMGKHHGENAQHLLFNHRRIDDVTYFIAVNNIQSGVQLREVEQDNWKGIGSVKSRIEKTKK